MAKVRQHGTAGELIIRRIIESYDVPTVNNHRALPGSPDIASEQLRFAIFVNGCYWHRHTGCKRATTPKTNRRFWLKKFAENRKRDSANRLRLRRAGYHVCTVWECELKDLATLKRRLLAFLETVDQGPVATGRTGRTTAVLAHKELVSGKVVRRVAACGRILGSCTIDQSAAARRYVDLFSAFDYAYLRGESRWGLIRSPSRVSLVDLFSGCGGLSLGVVEASRLLGAEVNVRLAVDSDPPASAVYQDNFEPERSHCGDICDLFGGELGSRPTTGERRVRRAVGDLDVLVAGPPCQGHSNLNNSTRRVDERNRLYSRAARAIEVLRPDFFLIENVPSVRHSHDDVLYESLKCLRRAGYNVSTAVVNLSQIGVPQERKRHVVVGSLSYAIDIDFSLERFRPARPRTVWWAISDLAHERCSGPFTTHAQLSRQNVRRIATLDRLGVYDLPDRYRPHCHQNGLHSYRSMYGRLRFNRPAQTITSGFGSPGQGRFIHPSLPRTLTPHEAARLQLFPDSFRFDSVASRSSLARIIGNAVPPRLSMVFALEYLLGRRR